MAELLARMAEQSIRRTIVVAFATALATRLAERIAEAAVARWITSETSPPESPCK